MIGTDVLECHAERHAKHLLFELEKSRFFGFASE
jgi:hypothetical protein